MIKLRSTPMLKAMGFRYRADLDFYVNGLSYGARIFRKSDELRALDIWKDLYKGNGEFAGSTLIVKNFPLDSATDSIQFYWDMFTRFSLEFEAHQLLDRFLYYIGRDEEELTLKIGTGDNGFICSLPKVFWQIDPISWKPS
ncbi:MAG: hypothetical protein N2491_03735 [Negativicutes bacterium]|nr:hypothetical protein [Negativicutes bacterium]